MPYKVKRGVVLVVTGPTDTLLSVMEDATRAGELPFFWVTSGIEGAHKDDSAHYEARALDIRNRDWTPTQTRNIYLRLAEIRDTLKKGALYFLPETDHLHIEWRE